MNELFMHRCIELAANGLGYVAPNPMVGAVLVHEEKIIGEGFHHRFGGKHAEVIAIENAIEKHGEEILKQATLYVSLEPCMHHGKTPPCCDLIIQKKISEVIIGCKDSFQEVNGGGIAKLKAAGCNVQVGFLEKECRELNKRFFTFHEKKRPFVILKFAQSADGFIAPENPAEENRWLSNEYSRKLVHKWRSEEQAILVGSKTAKEDNPRLTVRDWSGNNPVRIVLDRQLNLPSHLHLFDGSVPTLVFNEKESEQASNVEYVKIEFGSGLWKNLFSILHQRNIQSVIIEGGAKILESVIEAQLWDEARIFTGSKWLEKGVKAPAIAGTIILEQKIANDNLVVLANK